MAVYKVPQDVEAEDKLIGPLSFRQFIYLLIAAGSAFVGFMLFQISPFLVVIPLPIVLVFGALSLPLRKDQPMETYLLAIIRFVIKPKRRIWNPDGTITYVEITAPIVAEKPLTKNFSQEAAEERLDYLARIMDSRGWSSRGVNKMDLSVTEATANEALSATDILDSHADLAKSFDNMLAKNSLQNRKSALDKIQQAFHPTPQTTITPPNTQTPAPPEEPNQITPHFNPYPTIHQKVVLPAGYVAEAAATPKPQPTVPVADKVQSVSVDIARLANNNDLSISALAREAHRLADGDEGEVVISLH